VSYGYTHWVKKNFFCRLRKTLKSPLTQTAPDPNNPALPYIGGGGGEEPFRARITLRVVATLLFLSLSLSSCSTFSWGSHPAMAAPVRLAVSLSSFIERSFFSLYTIQPSLEVYIYCLAPTPFFLILFSLLLYPHFFSPRFPERERS